MTENLSLYIDHTRLNPDASIADITQLVKEAIDHKFISVCVNSHWISHCYELTKDTDVKVCTVIGFPLGATSTKAKVFETKQAIKDGATEIDMVLNIGELKSGNDQAVEQDIKSVVEAAKRNAIIKVIIETSLLNEDEKIRACLIAKRAGANFVKTSTGFSDGGATVDDIKLMRQTVGPTIGVKASGGIRDLSSMKSMIKAGATRIGASAGVSIINENNKE